MRNNEVLFSVKEIAKFNKISTETVRNRCKRLNIPKILINGHHSWHLNRFEVNEVVNFKNETTIPRVIYVNTHWLIIPSKLNFI